MIWRLGLPMFFGQEHERWCFVDIPIIDWQILLIIFTNIYLEHDELWNRYAFSIYLFKAFRLCLGFAVRSEAANRFAPVLHRGSSNVCVRNKVLERVRYLW